MSKPTLSYDNLANLLDSDFPDFRLQLSKFASESSSLPYVYAGHFADYITKLMLKSPEDDRVKEFFKIINKSFYVNDSRLENLIKLQFFDHWRTNAENQLTYIESELTGTAQSSFVNLLSHYRELQNKKGL